MKLPAVFFASALLANSPLLNASPLLQEVVVTASRIETPVRELGVAVNVLNADELELMGYQYMVDALRTLPGVAVSNQGGPGKITSVRIRGEEAYRTLYLLDGIEISDPSAPQAMAYAQHLGGSLGVERIEVLRGPQGFIYGADAGGVVNIISKTANGFNAEAELTTGEFATQNAQAYVANGGERGAAFLSIAHQSTDGFNATKTDPTEDLDGYRNTTAHAKFDWQVNSDLSLEAVLRKSDGHNQYDGCWGSEDCEDDTAQNVGLLGLRFQGERAIQRVAVSKTRVDRDYYTADVPGYKADGRTEKAEYLGAWEFNPQWQLAWGADYKTERMDTNYNDAIERHQTGLFSELRGEPLSNLHVAAGLRWDENNEYGEHVSVRVAPAYLQALNESITLKYRASFGTGFRAPSLSELAYNEGPYAWGEAAEIDLREEQSQGFDIGVDIYWGTSGQASIGYFDQQIEDEIYYDLVNMSGYLTAEGISHSKGWEVSASFPVSTFLTLVANYTYNETQTEADQPRPRRPKQLANVGLKGQWLAERLTILIHSRSAADSQDTSGDALPDYTVLDISGQWQFNSHVLAFVQLANATDKAYVEVENYNTAGRAAYGGVRFSF